jgi:hypothetical protein
MMPKTNPKTAPKPITDEHLDQVHGGTIGQLRTPGISDGTSNTLVKVGAGTLTLGGSNTPGG